ncbi:hypothetical protein J2S43_007858 [Catenuloplanes nepalensis]|uniref:Tail terminator n=1 Tax=Catenuloplanes nepalensis TaxID=587533 RepID=A0ABT9N6M0_9ACTN|nr:minor capsid protein [Catenuloplanes nepalensis]MDP9799346.1 hypothetical protein [Catenuloplanes nepalensis]
MAIGEGWTARLLTGLAEHLAAAGIGAWRPDGSPYRAAETAIVYRSIPPAPDRLITLAPYPVTGQPGLADVVQAVQIRLRGTADPRACDDLADAIYNLLDGASGLRWGGIAVVQVYRQSHTSLGQDGTGRWERSENYYVAAMRPTSNNTD